MNIPNANSDVMVQCLQGVSLGFTTRELVGGYVYSQSYTQLHYTRKNMIQDAIDACILLKLLDERGTLLNLNNNIRVSNWDDDTKRVIFRKYLQDFQPYIVYHSFMDMNDSSDIAARRMSILLNLSTSIEGEYNVLAKWGLFAGTLIEQSGIISISPDIKTQTIAVASPTIANLIASMDSEMAARSFVLQFLGQDAFDFVESDVQNDLARALTLSVSEPENAVVCIGRALEDHLKLIANARNIQLVDHNGNDITSIGPIISKLRHHRVIAKHQGNILRGLEVFTCTELLRGLNAWRNMPVHGRDSEADMRWSLGTEVALVGTFQLLLSIRSTYHYVVMHRILY